MSLGPVMVDIKGLELSQEEIEVLCHPLVGGLILFSRNYHSPDQLMKLLTHVHQLREPRLIIGVDQEGGRVQRFREGFTRLPALRHLGQAYEDDRKYAKHMAEIFAWLMASEMLSVGIDFCFAPVLDLDKGVSQVIGDRAFHSDPDVVSDLASSYLIGLNKAGMASVGKHFPGHGSVVEDSHKDIPIDARSYEEIVNEDIIPFERMIKHGLSAVMPAHVIYPQVDSRPAGFSPYWIKDILRKRLGFQGVVFSDDLSMEGASVAGDIVDRAQTALSAGCDMVLVCNKPDAAVRVIDELEDANDPALHIRLIRMHGKTSIDHQDLVHQKNWKYAVNSIEAFVSDTNFNFS